MADVLKLTRINKVYSIMDTHLGRRSNFWALKDVSFTLTQGTCTALTGENGSGKSTLFRIISRIITPTSGHVFTKGRVAPLLDLGAGFHDELTGRENIFVYASLLGIQKAELKQQFDQIVDFADVGRFLDTKLRSYSSGMKVRLAFSIASSLEPTLLLADEILSVGDEAFQQQCLIRILALKQEGTTILIAQHDRELLKQVCDEILVIEEGTLVSHSNFD